MKIWPLESQCINDEYKRCDSDRRWECVIPEKGREKPLWEQSEWDEEPLHSLVGQVVMAGPGKAQEKNFQGGFFLETAEIYPLSIRLAGLRFVVSLFLSPVPWDEIRPRMGRMKANTQTDCENFLPKTICTPRSREDLEVLIWLLEFAMKVLSISGIYSHSFAQFALNISEQMQTHSYLTLFHLNITARS